MMSDPGDPPKKSTDTGRFRALTDELATEVKDLLASEMKVLLVDFAQEVKTNLKEDVSGLRRLMTEHADTNLRAHEGTRRQVVHLTRLNAELWRTVKSEDPPAPPPNDDISFVEAARQKMPSVPDASGKLPRTPKPLSALTEAVEASDEQIDNVKGRLLRVESMTQELLSLQKEQMGKKPLGDGRSVLTRLVDGLLWAVRERDGQRYTATMIAGLTGLLWILAYTYATVTGHPPPPQPHSLGN